MIFDFDLTQTESRKVEVEVNGVKHEFLGNFQTPYILFPIASRVNTLYDLPPQVPLEVSAYDFERIKSYLARKGIPGSFESVRMQEAYLVREDKFGRIVRERVESIRPGLYEQPVYPDNYKYYMTDDSGRNYLVEALERAKASGIEKMFGPAHYLFALAMSNKETAEATINSTARVQDEMFPEYYARLQKELKKLARNKKGLRDIPYYQLRYMPNFALFQSASAEEFEQFVLAREGGRHLIGKRKAAGVEEKILKILENTLTVPADERLSADGRSRANLHYVIFIDNDQHNLNAVARLFKRYSGMGYIPIKYGIFNLGSEQQIRESGRPQFAILEPLGHYREATAEEIIGEPRSPSAEQKAFIEQFKKDGLSACRSYLRVVNEQ